MTAGTRQNTPQQAKPIGRVKLVPRPTSRRLEGTADGWAERPEPDPAAEESLEFYSRDVRFRSNRG